MLKIDQSAFIYNLFEYKNMTNYNSINILMKARFFIDIQKLGDYEKLEIKLYQQLIGKLIYILYGIRPNIFIIF